MSIIDKIDKLRNERKWTVYNLAMESGVTQSTLATMYQRKTPPKIETLQLICDAFGITLSQFFLESEETEILTAQEKELIKNFRTLSEKQKSAIITIIKKD